jgi:hypothetical protein
MFLFFSFSNEEYAFLSHYSFKRLGYLVGASGSRGGSGGSGSSGLGLRLKNFNM